MNKSELIEHMARHADLTKAAASRALPGALPENVLSVSEQKAVLADLMGIECLLNRHDCWVVEADASDMSECVPTHEKRIAELLAIGRAIIAEDQELWHDEQKAAFKPRYAELATTQSGVKGGEA